MKEYTLDYINENEFKKLERSLKKYNMLAFKKLNYDFYPTLRNGNFVGKKVNLDNENNTESYELKLPSDKMFTQIHGEVKLIYTVHYNEQKVILEEITPKDLLLEAHMSELTTYKGILISKKNALEDMKKIDLLDITQGKHSKVTNNKNYNNKKEENNKQKSTLKFKDEKIMKGYFLECTNEYEFKKLERALKKYNMLAFKKLNFDFYPALRNGNFLGEKVAVNKKNNTESYELKLPSDKMFTQIHGEVKLIYTVHYNEHVIFLEDITPSHILLSGHLSELTTYKGIYISKKNAYKDMFKIDLLNMLQNNMDFEYTNKKDNNNNNLNSSKDISNSDISNDINDNTINNDETMPSNDNDLDEPIEEQDSIEKEQNDKIENEIQSEDYKAFVILFIIALFTSIFLALFLSI